VIYERIKIERTTIIVQATVKKRTLVQIIKLIEKKHVKTVLQTYEKFVLQTERNHESVETE
jgi:hypothetical protein